MAEGPLPQLPYGRNDRSDGCLCLCDARWRYNIDQVFLRLLSPPVINCQPVEGHAFYAIHKNSVDEKVITTRSTAVIKPLFE